MSVSFLTTFKGFDEEPCGIQQYSAAYSWRLVKTKEVIVVGDDLGSKEICAEYGFTYEPRVKRGTNLGIKCMAPLLPSVIKQGLRRGTQPYICLINADLIVDPHFYYRLCRIVSHFGRKCFVTGIRLDFKWRNYVLGKAEYKRLWREVRPKCKYHKGGGTDFFVAHREWWAGMLSTMPPWILGQLVWDNWLQLAAVTHCRPAIDATGVIDTLHPVHGYEHMQKAAGLPAGSKLRKSPGYLHNKALQAKYGKTSIGNKKWVRLRTMKESIWA